MSASRRTTDEVSIHGLRLAFPRRSYLRPDVSDAYQQLSGRSVKNMDVWVAVDERVYFIEVTSSGTLKKHFHESGGGLRALAEDLSQRVMHTLLLLGAGLSGVEPAAAVVRGHARDLHGLRAKLVFLVAVGANDPERVTTLKDLIVHCVRPALAIYGLTERDVIVLTPEQARTHERFPFLN